VGIFILTRQQHEEETGEWGFIILTKYQRDDQFKKHEMNMALRMREISFRKSKLTTLKTQN
jgi:hypothetical protein